MKFRVKRVPEEIGVQRFDSPEISVYLHTTELVRRFSGRQEIDVTLEPVQTREERLREARIAGLKEFWRTTSRSGSYDEAKIIAVIERVDAEFGKENPG